MRFASVAWTMTNDQARMLLGEDRGGRRRSSGKARGDIWAGGGLACARERGVTKAMCIG